MEIQQDFKELLVLFNAKKVEYMIVGGYALAYHGAPRFTGDIDIFVKPIRKMPNELSKLLKYSDLAEKNCQEKLTSLIN